MKQPTIPTSQLVFGWCVLMLLPMAMATQPKLISAIPDTLIPATAGQELRIDLTQYFTADAVANNTVRVTTSLGGFNMKLRPDRAPQSVANFLAYMNDGAYENMLIHRSAKLENGDPFVIQTGGYIGYGSLSAISKWAAVPNEYGLPNAPGTVAMAKMGGDPNSATSEWFVNVHDNSTILDTNNNEGFTVFAEVLGTGMSDVVDKIAAVPIFSFGSFTELPLVGVTQGQTDLQYSNLVTVNRVATLPFFALSSDSGAYSQEIQGSDLVVRFQSQKNSPTAITVQASDASGLTTSTFFQVWHGKASQTITFPPIPSQVHGAAPFTFKDYPTSSSGRQVAVDIVSGPTKVSNGQLYFTGPGTVTLKATQLGSAVYNPADPVTISFQVKTSQTITFAQPTASQAFVAGRSFALRANAPGGPVSFSSSDANVISISGTTATLKGAGTAVITASQAGSDKYAAAAAVVRSLTVTRGSQTLLFAQPSAPKTYTANGTFALSASALGGAVTFSSSNPSVISVSGSTATVQGAGTAVITATQQGNQNYAAAKPVARLVTIQKASQVISFTQPATPQAYAANGTFSLNASAADGAVTFSSSNNNVISVSGSTATIKGVGMAVITATQAGSQNYTAAKAVTRLIKIGPVY
jgi:cyclophilin family peptidyl-prolyl cis-trans isomerase